LAAKEFLDEELAKYDSYEKYSQGSLRALFKGTKGDFKKAKNHGVGESTICKFLGGNWKQWMIQQALDTLKDKTRAGTLVK